MPDSEDVGEIAPVCTNVWARDPSVKELETDDWTD